MEVTDHSTKSLFNRHIKKLMDDMEASYDSGTIDSHVREFQARLDKLDDTYQDNESLGQLRYKLYFVQAYIHYFKQDYKNSLEFMRDAVDMRGKSFSEAEAFEKLILNSGYSRQRFNLNPAKRFILDHTKWVIGLVLAVFILGTSYWFLARPYFIKKQCNKIAWSAAGQLYGNAQNPGSVDAVAGFSDTNNSYYTLCLHSKGL